ncbi:hypothetical protein O6R05_00885 [Peptoniphilus equinus]|uniref:Uncharacterized protein n=1 Tax=Peptoniphilus equinus TaxID=3016343 RepID=A0ABY7QTN2_9FIRM|nr:hypothetical protein [Peptoniphilus equinus]WBW50148.1 hypothetical protein O6R05_00885 [Peptoniphilus equinus]
MNKTTSTRNVAVLLQFFDALPDLIRMEEDHAYQELLSYFSETLLKTTVVLDNPSYHDAIRRYFEIYLRRQGIPHDDLSVEPLLQSRLLLVEQERSGLVDMLRHTPVELEPVAMHLGECALVRVMSQDGTLHHLGTPRPLTFINAKGLAEEFVRIAQLGNVAAENYHAHSMDLLTLYQLIAFNSNFNPEDTELFDDGALLSLMFNPPELDVFMGQHPYHTKSFAADVALLEQLYFLSVYAEDMNFSSYLHFDYEALFAYAVKEGFFTSTDAFLETVRILYNLYDRLSLVEPTAKKPAKELKQVADRTFDYMSQLTTSTAGFFLEHFPHLSYELSEIADHFLQGVTALSLRMNSSRSALTGSSLAEAVTFLDVPRLNRKTLLQSHVPTLDFILRLFLIKDIVTFEGDGTLLFGDSYMRYRTLSSDEKSRFFLTALHQPSVLALMYPSKDVHRINGLKARYLDSDPTLDPVYCDFFRAIGLRETTPPNPILHLNDFRKA